MAIWTFPHQNSPLSTTERQRLRSSVLTVFHSGDLEDSERKQRMSGWLGVVQVATHLAVRREGFPIQANSAKAAPSFRSPPGQECSWLCIPGKPVWEGGGVCRVRQSAFYSSLQSPFHSPLPHGFHKRTSRATFPWCSIWAGTGRHKKMSETLPCNLITACHADGRMHGQTDPSPLSLLWWCKRGLPPIHLVGRRWLMSPTVTIAVNQDWMVVQRSKTTFFCAWTPPNPPPLPYLPPLVGLVDSDLLTPCCVPEDINDLDCPALSISPHR